MHEQLQHARLVQRRAADRRPGGALCAQRERGVLGVGVEQALRLAREAPRSRQLRPALARRVAGDGVGDQHVLGRGLSRCRSGRRSRARGERQSRRRRRQVRHRLGQPQRLAGRQRKRVEGHLPEQVAAEDRDPLPLREPRPDRLGQQRARQRGPGRRGFGTRQRERRREVLRELAQAHVVREPRVRHRAAVDREYVPQPGGGQVEERAAALGEHLGAEALQSARAAQRARARLLGARQQRERRFGTVEGEQRLDQLAEVEAAVAEPQEPDAPGPHREPLPLDEEALEGRAGRREARAQLALIRPAPARDAELDREHRGVLLRRGPAFAVALERDQRVARGRGEATRELRIVGAERQLGAAQRRDQPRAPAGVVGPGQRQELFERGLRVRAGLVGQPALGEEADERQLRPRRLVARRRDGVAGLVGAHERVAQRVERRAHEARRRGVALLR
ncbi:MAG: hypothetical protein AAF682_12310 [Planctomycetota bacterium]